MADPNQLPPLRHITLDLLRKRSEHNEGLVSTLEELALHQEELEAVGPVLGRTCGRTLKILLLQNNVISTLTAREMKMLTSLEYLNLALNNLTVMGGGVLDRCEFLTKVDLTLNFVDVDGLEETVESLGRLQSLTELYLVGNPCAGSDVANESSGGDSSTADVVTKAAEALQINLSSASSDEPNCEKARGWKGCRLYVIGNLPNLRSLDGKAVLRSERILAKQHMPALTAELRQLAKIRRAQRVLEDAEKEGQLGVVEDVGEEYGNDNDEDSAIGDEELTGHTPEVRAKISREMAQQKAAKEAQEKANRPQTRGEKECEDDQRAAISRAREREERGDIKQCNEGRWSFRFDEETKPGYVLLDVTIQKFLSSSLIDVDVHPTYVSIVIKGRVLRLILPAEVRSEESSAQRSTTTGHLLVTMPKVDPKENMISIRAARKYKEEKAAGAAAEMQREKDSDVLARAMKGSTAFGKSSTASQMMDDAAAMKTAKKSVCIEGLVDEKFGGVKQESRESVVSMKAVCVSRNVAPQDDGDNDIDNSDSDEPPALF